MTAPVAAPGTHVVLLILEDGGIEGPLLPLLWAQGNLTAEPPGVKDEVGHLRAGGWVWKSPPVLSAVPRPTGGNAPVGCLLEPQPALLHLPLQLGRQSQGRVWWGGTPAPPALSPQASGGMVRPGGAQEAAGLRTGARSGNEASPSRLEGWRGARGC